MADSVNKVSQTSFTQNHELYDEVRFGYIPEAVETLLTHLEISSGAKVVEIGAGTGKFTTIIDGAGYDIVAVEPSAGMIESFKKKLPHIPTIEGSVYDIPLENGYADAVIVAQAFHWFGNVGALKEIARLLRPGGKLALIWNYENFKLLKDDSFQKQIADYIHSFDSQVPQYRRMEWIKAFEDQPYFYVPYHEEHFSYKKLIPADPEFLWRYWESRSYITALSEEERNKIKQQVYKIHADTVKPSDIHDGQLTLNMGVHIVWATRK
jgi:SAM-dependent methyltransferase